MTLSMRLVKITDIAYVNILYFIYGYYSSKLIENIFKQFYGDKSKFINDSKGKLIFQILLQVTVIGIMAYIGRNIIELIPFPLNNYAGYDHLKLKELSGAGLVTFYIFLFSYNLTSKIDIIRSM
jgi:hypothetical protein